MDLKPKTQVLFLEFRPGTFHLVRGAGKKTKKSWVEGLAGKYRDDSIDAVQSLLDDKKEDLILEERGYLN